MAKRTLLVFRQRGTDKPEFITNVVVDTAMNVLGARDVIALAYADLDGADELRVIREDEAIKRRWVLKKSFQPHNEPLNQFGRVKHEKVSANVVNPFDG